MPSTWVALFCDLLTDVPITTLPLDGPPKWASQIIVPGAFTAKITTTNPEMTARVRQVFPREDLWPPPAGAGRVKCHIFQGPTFENLWDSYVVWENTNSGDENLDNGYIDISGAQLASYMWHRQIWDDLAYAQEDQIDIAHSLVADMQFELGGDIGIGTSGALSGVLRDREYPASSALWYGETLAQLASVDGGFEWVVQSYVDEFLGHRVHDFVTGYPNLADPAPDLTRELYVSRPGNILSYKYLSSAIGTANRFRGRGDTINDDITNSSEPLLGSVVTDTTLTGGGWAYLDQTVDYQSVIDVTTLDSYARWWRDTRSGVSRVLDLTVRFDDTFPLHPRRHLGKYVNMSITDQLYPLDDQGRPTFQQRSRLVGIEVEPNGRGQGQDIAHLILEEGARAA
jgi:hypothetical protein